jgi:predicted TIM-barrel fold metal-dependent hydrolase
MEPTDLYTAQLSEIDRHRAPIWHRLPDGTKLWVQNGVPRSLGPEYRRPPLDGVSEPELIGPADVDGFLADLERDGVDGAVLHPNVSLGVFDLDDPAFALRCAQIYNDHVAELYLGVGQLYPMPLIPLLDIDDALGEIERAVKLGFRGLELAINAPAGQPAYYSRRYDPIWEVAQAHGLPIFAHAAAGQRNGNYFEMASTRQALSGSPVRDREHPDHLEAMLDDKTAVGVGAGASSYMNDLARKIIISLVAGGVPERFPNLHFVITEVGACWLQNLMDAMDDSWYVGPGCLVWNRTRFLPDGSSYKQFEPGEDQLEWPYELAPSDYVRRQFHVTFMDDWRALRNRHVTGIEPLLWGNDYPHPEGCWPESQAAVEAQAEKANLTSDEREAIFGGTLKSLLHV